MPNTHMLRACSLLAFLAAAAALNAQMPGASQVVDPAKVIANPVLQSSVHKPLPEQIVLLAMPPATAAKPEAVPRYFRASFSLETIPSEATLYIASYGTTHAFLNGQSIAEAERPAHSNLRPLVLTAPVAKVLRRGTNLVAIEVEGESAITVKIIPAQEGVGGPALFISGPGGRTSLSAASGWEHPGFDDTSWQAAKPLGSVDTLVQLNPEDPQATSLEWNADSGMYRWPDYQGISPYLAHLPIPAESVDGISPGAGRFDNIPALKQLNTAAEFTVELPRAKLDGSRQEAPSIILDLGRETNGRLEVRSASDQPIRLTLQYGESREEALKSPYLGVNELLVPPRATVYGPKSAFRYIQLKFLAGPSPLRFKSIHVDAIYYPVEYRGSFESSDPLVNRIWALGAYTSRLCMQDAIWDAPKRDRGPWMGDLYVSGGVINTVFADQFLMQNTMDRLISNAGDPVVNDVNGIPGYSAFWVMGEADYYRHIGNKNYLRSIHAPLIRLLDYMTTALDSQNIFVNARKAWPFVDWSPGFDKDTPEARRATQFAFYRAFVEGAWLLGESGDSDAAQKYRARAETIRDAAQRSLLDQTTGTFGSRWQANAMAIFSGVADAKQTALIWDRVLSRPSEFMISPYYNYFVIAAMAQAGHRREALDWIRKYWGGMVAQGATSFWEAYDLSWPKEDFHASLQADDDKGYFVSLAHGWSSGPTLWLAQQVLGIRPTDGGFRTATIRPDLAGLDWARGSVPTPHGPIHVDYKSLHGFDATVDVPSGIDTTVSMPSCNGGNALTLNGRGVTGQLAESGSRVELHVPAGRSILHCRLPVRE